jgi:hypothetical protein
VSSASPTPSPRAGPGEVEGSPVPQRVSLGQHVGGVPIKPPADDPDPNAVAGRDAGAIRGQHDARYTSSRAISPAAPPPMASASSPRRERFRVYARRDADGRREYSSALLKATAVPDTPPEDRRTIRPR